MVDGFRYEDFQFYFQSPGLSWRVPLIAHFTRTKSLRTLKGEDGEENEGLSATRSISFNQSRLQTMSLTASSWGPDRTALLILNSRFARDIMSQALV